MIKVKNATTGDHIYISGEYVTTITPAYDGRGGKIEGQCTVYFSDPEDSIVIEGTAHIMAVNVEADKEANR